MLRSRHLVLIRAALQYWDEEQSPHGTDAFSGYVDEVPPDGELSPEDVADVRVWLENCDVRYIVSDPAGTNLLSHRIFETIEDADDANSANQGVIAPVLLSLNCN